MNESVSRQSSGTVTSIRSILETGYGLFRTVVKTVVLTAAWGLWTAFWGVMFRLHVLQGDIAGVVITGLFAGGPLIGILWYVVSMTTVGDWGLPSASTT